MHETIYLIPITKKVKICGQKLTEQGGKFYYPCKFEGSKRCYTCSIFNGICNVKGLKNNFEAGKKPFFFE
jgi:hypothetical protein